MRTDRDTLAAIKEHLKQTSNNQGKPVEQIRKEMEDAAGNLPQLPGVTVEAAAIGHLHGEWVRAGDQSMKNSGKAILYFHGGGFISGSCEIYRDLAARISQASGVSVLTLEYRLAPEHLYPAANDDCLYAYRWLLSSGYAASNLVLGGDSVGGSLALMTLFSLRDAGDELPAAAFLFSPHTDLVHLDGESYQSRADLDPLGSLQGNQQILQDYLGDYSGVLPEQLSPLRMNLYGLPGMLIQAGDHEVLLSDATRFTELAKAAGIEVTLEIWENMWSVFQLMAALLPEGQQAITSVGQYVRRALGMY